MECLREKCRNYCNGSWCSCECRDEALSCEGTRNGVVISSPESTVEDMAVTDPFPRQPQRQDALSDQLADLYILAVRAGLYDAADWLTARWASSRPGRRGPVPPSS